MIGLNTMRNGAGRTFRCRKGCSSFLHVTTRKASKSTNNFNDCFSVLGIEKTFSIDPVELKKTYKNLMTKLHPDKMNANPSRENIKSDFDASDVTHAYEIISNPLTRASHMLEANGILINEKDSGQDLLGMEFLMQVMEIREIIDGISNSSSAVKDSELIDSKLRPLLEENQQHMKVTIKNLNETFQSNDLEAAKKLTAQLQYWSRIEETIVEKMSRVN